MSESTTPERRFGYVVDMGISRPTMIVTDDDQQTRHIKSGKERVYIGSEVSFISRDKGGGAFADDVQLTGFCAYVRKFAGRWKFEDRRPTVPGRPWKGRYPRLG